jgi:hypothetical protein
MKKIIFPLLLACCSALYAADDCAKNSNACSDGGKPVSPFLAASALPPPVPAPAVVTKPAPASQAPAPAKAAPGPLPVPVPVQDSQKLSSPLWLLLIGAGFAALYFYLGGKSRKRKR